MKNIFWFLAQPADERERELLGKAHKEAHLSMSVLLIVLIMFVRHVHPFNQATPNLLTVTILAILLISYVNGWWVIRRESLVGVSTNQPSVSLLPVALTFGGLVLAGLLIILIIPAYAWVSMVCFLFAPIISLMLWALRWARSYSEIAQVLAIFFPFLAIPWIATKRYTSFKRWALTAMGVLIFWFGIMGYFMWKRQLISEPIYLSAAHLEPDIPKDSLALLVKVLPRYSIGSSSLIQENSTLRAVRILEVLPEEKFRVQLADHEEVVSRDQLLGTLHPIPRRLLWVENPPNIIK